MLDAVGFEGSHTRFQETTSGMSDFLRDVRYALRALRNRPGFASVAVATLALGVGANAAAFTLIDRVLLRPLPGIDLRGLVTLRNAYDPPRPDSPRWWPGFTEWRKQSAIFSHVEAYAWGSLTYDAPDIPFRVSAAQVTPGLFTMLGVRPALGRGFLEEEGTPQRDQVVVLSYEFWNQHLGHDFNAIGQSISLNELPFVVVGVMPQGFAFPRGSDVWVPYAIPRDARLSAMFRTSALWMAVARLQPGISLGQAQSRVTQVDHSFRQREGSLANWNALTLVPLREVLLGNAAERLAAVFATSWLILLIACANMAAFWLAQHTMRQRDVAVRAALGAPRQRLIRELSVEGLVLALGGSIVGLLGSFVLQRALTPLIPRELADVTSLTPDASILALALLAGTMTTLLFAVVPAARIARVDIASLLRIGGYRTSTRRSRRTQAGVLTAELALALILTVGAGLMLRSLINVTRLNPGFESRGVLTAAVTLPSASFNGAQAAQFYSNALQRARGLPGVTAAGAVNVLPLAEGSAGFAFQIVGRPPFADGPDKPFAEFLVATPGYFRALGIPVLRGRVFSEDDARSTLPVVVINETMAKHFWPGTDPLGAQLQIPGDTTPHTVVGVVGSVRSVALEEQDHWQGQMYFSYLQVPARNMTIAVRTATNPASLSSPLRRTVAEVNPGVAIFDVRRMDDVVSAATRPRALTTVLVVLAGFLAAALAIIGVYGVTSQVVAQRGHEIAVRIALGAPRRDLVWFVSRLALLASAAGIGAGLAGSWFGMRLLRGLLYGVAATDREVLVGVALLLGAVVAIACYLPARKALRSDPVVALKDE